MNQCLKDAVYHKGSKRHVDFMADCAGMNDEETQILQMIHDGRTDDFIREELALSPKSYARVEESVRAKLLLAVFECINYTMDHRK